ncbi:MAG: hypothetical protein K2X48_13885 [Chitinophagaceae bacterium]|nr:hypothetical protein [Chitinophagaceae bacterium]
MVRRLFVTITLLFIGYLLQGQQKNILSNLRTKKIATKPAVQHIDTVSIVPNSFIITGIAPDSYKIDEVNAKLTWLHPPAYDSVTVTYRAFNFKLNASVRRMNFDDVMNNFVTKPITFESEGLGKGLFDFGNVNYNGSFGRGISFGNNQDAVVNGVLNLQINGMIGDSMMLSAALTDNNIPVQAEGNTQQLNEFDQVWIQLKKKGWQLNLGDIDIRRNEAYFLSFFKRLQGASFQTENKVFKKGNNKAIISGAIAKGKFSRFIFQGQEGNQGPYRLQGPNGELFFIVLAGTERVFIDGELMQRGEDQDYVINYNTAEVTFTPKRMINKDRRIQIEFEYNDRNYLNSLFIFGDDLVVNKHLSFHVNGFSNIDSKNSSITQQLTPEQKKFLADAGDVPNGALYPAVSRDTFASTKIVYRKIDTLVNAVLYRDVLVFTPVAFNEVYGAVFTKVGQGNGDYVQTAAGANGRTFQWVAPINGIKQGRFDPVVRLIAPRTQQMATFGADYLLSNKLLMKSEVALSRFDVNTFSTKDKGNDLGWAGRVQLQYTDKFSKKKNALNYKINTGYEYVQEQFRALERLRPVEFTREWGLPIFLQQQEEKIANAGFELFRTRDNRMSYKFQTYNRGLNFKGIRHAAEHFINQKGWTWNARINYSSVDSNTNKGFFLRPLVELKKRMPFIKNIEVGGSYYLEHNENRKKINDSLALASFSWDTWTLFLRSPESSNKWGLNFFTRRDQLPIGKNFEQVDRSFNYNGYVELMKNEHHQFRLNATLRELKIYNSTLTNLKPERTLLSRAEYFVTEWKGLLAGNVLYEVGSGQEQRRDFSYLEVPAGQGEYTWNDYNNDGIPQLNEFEIAQFRDQARYIRVFTPTLDFIRANYNQFNYSLNINPRAVIDVMKATGIKKFLTRVSTQSSMQIFKKEVSNKNFSLNPFSKPGVDSNLISLSSVISNTLFFNRTSSVWGFEATQLRSVSRSLLTYGLETRTLRETNNRLRWNFNKSLASSFNIRFIKNQLETPRFGNRNFDLDQLVLEPLISYQQGTKYRFSLSYKYESKDNRDGLKERARINSMIAEARYNVLSSSTINGKFQFSNIAFTGQTNTTAAFIMLDALLPGKNFLWNLDFTKRLANNMEINFSYEGRKPGTGRTIHTGRAGVRALF